MVPLYLTKDKAQPVVVQAQHQAVGRGGHDAGKVSGAARHFARPSKPAGRQRLVAAQLQRAGQRQRRTRHGLHQRTGTQDLSSASHRTEAR